MSGKKSLAVIGFGRFGSFWAKQLSAFFDVRIYDADKSRLNAGIDFQKNTSLEEALASDYVYLTIPIRKIENFLKENLNLIGKNTVLIDAASIKKPVVGWFEKYLKGVCEFMFTHPLFGPDSGAEGLSGLSIAVQPGEISYSRYKYVIDIFEQMKLNILALPYEEHDYLMVYNLNLIHLLGRTLDGMGISKIPLKMNALTYLNGMSKYVVNDSKTLFEDFFRFNPYAEKIKKDFVENLNKILNELP